MIDVRITKDCQRRARLIIVGDDFGDSWELIVTQNGDKMSPFEIRELRDFLVNLCLRMDDKNMSKLTAAKRNKLKKSSFGLPGEKKYPMPDKKHAANAKARATQMEKKGKLSPSSKAKIDAKANKILKRK